MRAEEQRNRRQLEKKFGEDYTDYTGFARYVVQLGVTPQHLNTLKEVMFDGRELQDVKVDELDWFKARDYLELFRRIETLRDVGIDEERLRFMTENFRPRSDFDRNVRAGRAQPLTEADLKELGLTRNQVEKMSREERQRIINEYFN